MVRGLVVVRSSLVRQVQWRRLKLQKKKVERAKGWVPDWITCSNDKGYPAALLLR